MNTQGSSFATPALVLVVTLVAVWAARRGSWDLVFSVFTH
jgi:hypothetical protein